MCFLYLHKQTSLWGYVPQTFGQNLPRIFSSHMEYHWRQSDFMFEWQVEGPHPKSGFLKREKKREKGAISETQDTSGKKRMRAEIKCCVCCSKMEIKTRYIYMKLWKKLFSQNQHHYKIHNRFPTKTMQTWFSSSDYPVMFMGWHVRFSEMAVVTEEPHSYSNALISENY